MCLSVLSPESSTAAMPPCAQLLAPSLHGALGDDRDLARLRQVQGDHRPARPLPTMATSKFHAAASPSIFSCAAFVRPVGRRP